VEAFLGIQPTVMLVTPLRSPSPPQPAADADALAEETLVSKPVGSTVVTPRISNADSSAEVVASPALLLSSPPAPMPEMKQEPDEICPLPRNKLAAAG